MVRFLGPIFVKSSCPLSGQLLLTKTASEMSEISQTSVQNILMFIHIIPEIEYNI